MADRPAWIKAMWEELSSLPPMDQVTVASAWITCMTNEILTELGEYRRLVVANLLTQPGIDPQYIADMTGMRRSTVERLAEEGRRLCRAKGREPGDVVETP